MRQPDAPEKGIRFGCGFIWGIIISGTAAATAFAATGYSMLAWSIGAGVICGLLAMRLGDEFWIRDSDWWWRLWWLGLAMEFALLWWRW